MTPEVLAEPAKALVRAVAWLPDAIRPGMFLVAVAALVWLVFVQRALPSLWHATCRAVAVSADVIVGLAVFPEYVITSSRQRHGKPPGPLTRRASPFAEGMLAGARSLYRAHDRTRLTWRRPPWKTFAAIFVICGVAWVVMDRAPESSDLKHRLAGVFDVWRETEAWAGVDASRRAAPGEPSIPQIQARKRRGGLLHVVVRCDVAGPCHGLLVAETPSGRELASREIALTAGEERQFRLRLPTRAPKRVRAVVRPATD